MWSIGRIRFDSRTVLGPMSGFTSRSYREFMAGFGPAVAVTEMVSSKGLLHDPVASERFVSSPKGCPTGVQVFGGEPDIVAKGAARALEINPDLLFVDVNMGCPVPKVIRSGSGSALMKDPRKCGDVVRAVKDSVDVPVTAKIRLGGTDETMNFREVIDELLKADVDAVTVHARTVDQRYAGRSRPEFIRNLGREIPVPLIVSGDIYSADDALRAIEVTDAEGIMIARGGVGNPFLIAQVNSLLDRGIELPDPTMREQSEWCLRLMDMTIDELGDKMGLARLRSLVPKFLAGCRYSREYRRAVTDPGTDYEEMRGFVVRMADELGDERRRCEGTGLRLEDRTAMKPA